ncbi:hypothetical protein QKT26_gp52 [Carcinus maenas nudivirus]|uniref:Uncharacterized protein n=1 Tax=Carcinus maenas nudivirus TaxID=2880837 RepID=A0AAE9BZW3_9VIRU|nr:hypothetical protein QKT26_gp52 [Carcinus maenas nudivirus]UBZ25642.1 hypothetical protein CmNV_051 [Carcinus maenas nudivirus]
MSTAEIPQYIQTKYILRKLFNNKKVASYLSKSDLADLKKICEKELPLKIKDSNQIKLQINDIVEDLITKKAYYLQYIMDQLKVTVVQHVCNAIDKIVERRKMANDKKILSKKTLKN